MSLTTDSFKFGFVSCYARMLEIVCKHPEKEGSGRRHATENN